MELYNREHFGYSKNVLTIELKHPAPWLIATKLKGVLVEKEKKYLESSIQTYSSTNMQGPWNKKLFMISIMKYLIR